MASLSLSQARLFLALAVPLGLGYAALNPPFSVSDEATQLASSTALSRAELAPLQDQGGAYRMVPADFASEVARYAPLPRDEESRVDHAAWWQSLRAAQASAEPVRFAAPPDARSLLTALPQLPAVWLGRLFSMPALPQLYLARLSALTAYALIGAAAVALAGRLSWLLFVLALTPAALSAGASLASAGLPNALALLLAALFARATQAKAPSDRRERLALALVAVAMAACKAPLLLLALALVALAPEGAPEGASQARRWALAGAVLLAGGVLIASQWALDPRPLVPAPTPTWQRILWPLSDPLRAWRLLRVTLFRRGDEAFLHAIAIGGSLAHQMRLMATVIATLHTQLVIALAWGAMHNVLPRQRAQAVVRWTLGAALASCVAIGFSLYLAEPNIPTRVLESFTGEPFFAVLPWLAIAMAFGARPFAARWLLQRPGSRVVMPVVVLNLYCLLSLFGRFHADPAWQFPY